MGNPPRIASIALLSLTALTLITLISFGKVINPIRDLSLVPFAIAAGLGLVFCLPHRWHEASLLAFLTVTFSCILFGRWHAGVTDGEVIAGKIPFSDASGYLLDAVRLLDGWPLSPFSSRRPIHVLVLARFLKLANGNFALACLLVSTFATVGIAAITVAVRRTLGSAAAYVFILLAILFYRRFIGTTLSEHAGFAFACLATALLWRGAETRSLAELCCGAFLLTIALVARAGCFFVLPSVAIWIGWNMRRTAWPNWKAMSLAAASIIAGFALNNALLHVFGTPGSSFSNFPVTLYGLISGGNWTSFSNDYPAIAALPEAEAAPQIVTIVLDRLRQDPWLLWHGALRAWRDFFSVDSGQFLFMSYGFDATVDLAKPTGSVILSYLDAGPAIVRQVGMALLVPWWPTMAKHFLYDLLPWAVFALGAAVALRNPSEPRNQLLICAWVGIIASIPFNSPWDSDLMRSYAATMPLQFLPLAVGAAAIQAFLQSRLRRPAARPFEQAMSARRIGLCMAAAFLPLLCLIRLAMPEPSLVKTPDLNCASGSGHLARMIKGTEITLSATSEGFGRCLFSAINLA